MYATLEEFKDYLRIPTDDEVDDAEMTRALQVASNTVDHLCSQTFEVASLASETRYFEGPAGYYYTRRRWTEPLYRVPIPPVQDDTGLTVNLWTEADSDYSTLVTGWELRPVNASIDGRPWTELVLPSTTSIPNVDYPIAITARWGWTELPAGVVQATLLEAARVFKRRDATFGILSSPDGSMNTRLQNAVDPNVYSALDGLIKYWTVR